MQLCAEIRSIWEEEMGRGGTHPYHAIRTRLFANGRDGFPVLRSSTAEGGHPVPLTHNGEYLENLFRQLIRLIFQGGIAAGFPGGLAQFGAHRFFLVN